MHATRWNLWPGLLVFILLAGGVLARVLLCPRCGHEYESGQAACPHCQQALPEAAPALSPAEPTAPAAESAVVTRALLDSELAAARAALEDERPALAWLRSRNLAGLLALAGPAPEVASGRSEVERTALADLRDRTRPCPSCKGTGLGTRLFVNIRGEPSQQQMPGTPCLACGGRGTWKARPTEDDLENAFAQAQRNLATELRDAGWTSAGPGWLPPGITNLDLHMQVAARQAVAGPCDTCRGQGATGCTRCEGAGRTACTGRNCVAGQVVCPDCQGTRRMSANEDGRSLNRRCTTCRQTGVIDCPDCEGRAYLVCETCAGSGEERCDACRGSGEKALCKSCAGEGLRAGRRKGDPEELCRSCLGSGRAGK